MRIGSLAEALASGISHEKVRFDRRLFAASSILALFLCWPLFIFGRPAYYDDTPSYYKGGNAALSFVAEKMSSSGALSAGPAAVTGAAPIAAIVEAKGARSVSYSVLTALLAGPGATLIPLAILQALLLAFCVATLLRACEIGRPAFAVATVLLSVGTPAAWYASFASPDVFAGITILVIATLGVFGERMSRPVTLALILVGAFAITTHSSHLALAIAMLGLALLCSRRLRKRVFGNRNMFLLTVGPAVLGLAIVVISGFIGFGEISLAPKRYPLTLARSVEGGAARRYLQDVCPARRYLVCEMYPNGLPARDRFLWSSEGIVERSTPAQMQRLRAEEWEIVTYAALRYPWIELSQAAGGGFHQLAAFGVNGVSFDQRLSITNTVNLLPDRRTPKWLEAALNILIYASAIMSFLGLACFYRRLSSQQRSLTLYVMSGLVLNATICAYFSAVADRYGARVIWLLPLLIISVSRNLASEAAR